MATTTKLVVTCGTTSGKRNFSWNYIRPDLSTSDAKDVCDGLITNGAIFTYTPLMYESAKLVTVSESEFDFS